MRKKKMTKVHFSCHSWQRRKGSCAHILTQNHSSWVFLLWHQYTEPLASCGGEWGFVSGVLCRSIPWCFVPHLNAELGALQSPQINYMLLATQSVVWFLLSDGKYSVTFEQLCFQQIHLNCFCSVHRQNGCRCNVYHNIRGENRKNVSVRLRSPAPLHRKHFPASSGASHLQIGGGERRCGSLVFFASEWTWFFCYSFQTFEGSVGSFGFLSLAGGC